MLMQMNYSATVSSLHTAYAKTTSLVGADDKLLHHYSYEQARHKHISNHSSCNFLTEPVKQKLS